MSIDINMIKKSLKTDIIGRNIIAFDLIDSTNTQAKYAAEIGVSNGTVLIAENQTSGRGRQGHSWISSYRENVLMTILIYPEYNESRFLSSITLAMGVAVTNALERVSNTKVNLKWPNDILAEGKKVCGILCERFTRNARDCIAVGIGVNVNGCGFPESISDKATSLFLLTGEKFIIEKVISEILNDLEDVYIQLRDGNLNDIMNIYKSRCISIGKNVEVVRNEYKINGVVEDVYLSGELAVRSCGKLVMVSSFDSVKQEIY